VPDAAPIMGPLSLVLSAVACGRCSVINPFGAVLTQNKRSRALTWEELPRFSGEAQTAIRRYLPPTLHLESLPAAQLKRERQRWVLKSDYGAEGEEVIVGTEYTQVEWCEAVDRAVPDGGSCSAGSRRWPIRGQHSELSRLCGGRQAVRPVHPPATRLDGPPRERGSHPGEVAMTHGRTETGASWLALVAAGRKFGAPRFGWETTVAGAGIVFPTARLQPFETVEIRAQSPSVAYHRHIQSDEACLMERREIAVERQKPTLRQLLCKDIAQWQRHRLREDLGQPRLTGTRADQHRAPGGKGFQVHIGSKILRPRMIDKGQGSKTSAFLRAVEIHHDGSVERTLERKDT